MTADSSLRDGLRRWRDVFVGLAVFTALVALAGFAAERAFEVREHQSGTVLRAATAAQRAIWLHESAIRKFGLLKDSLAPARSTAARDTARSRLVELKRLTADDPSQLARLDTLGRALDAWDAAFATPILRTGSVTLAMATAGTRTFDEVSRIFDSFIGSESEQQLDRIRAQGIVAWTGLLLLLVAILVITLTGLRVARQLDREAERADAQQRRLEEQTTRMGQQTRLLEDQASQLEEQTAELEHQVGERDETNRILEQTAAYLDSAVESAPLSVAFFGLDLRFVRVNDAMSVLSGLAAAAHVGRTTAEMLPSFGPALVPVLSRVLRTGASEADVSFEADTPARAGVTRRWRVTCYPLRAKGRPPIGVGAMIRDVTERTQLEEQLRQSQKMEAVGRLAGGIAHDFNNVLTIIQSYGELLAAGLEPGAPGRSEVDAICGAADRAAALARQLLSFSRRDVVIPRILDLNDVVRGMEGILRRLLRQGVELEIAIDAEPQLVRIDAGQLEQVMMNLAINGVDAMPEGGTLRIAIHATNRIPHLDGAREESATVISVSDSGMGMTREVRERLFEPFFTTKPAGRGTGLGLATAYAIINAAGGAIRVSSALGEGSTFDVVLPRKSAADLEPEARVSPARGAAILGSNETVLLVEDEPGIRMALARVLRANGYRVIEASNGGEALRLAGDEPGVIHLLLTDVMMPGVGGKELVQRLLVSRPTTRILLMSGYTDDELLRRELGEARYVFLQKPFAARRAVAAVRELLDAE